MKNTRVFENRLQSNFLQLLTVHEVIHVRRNNIHPSETLVAEPRASEFDMSIQKFKRYKSPGTEQITV
jgi:hypothetical protein